eukprot:4261480-Pleurochrysis_carterae.AAC.3
MTHRLEQGFGRRGLLCVGGSRAVNDTASCDVTHWTDLARGCGCARSRFSRFNELPLRQSSGACESSSLARKFAARNAPLLVCSNDGVCFLIRPQLLPPLALPPSPEPPTPFTPHPPCRAPPPSYTPLVSQNLLSPFAPPLCRLWRRHPRT